MNGFEVLKTEEIWNDYILSAEVKKLKPLDLTSFNDKLNRVVKQVDSFINSFKKIAVWGAGHQALLVLSQIKSKRKIKYVVDSARFKQNKYTPASHIPIVSPEELSKNPVEAIIVMAGSYSNEVVKILMQKYDRKIKISILSEEGLQKFE